MEQTRIRSLGKDGGGPDSFPVERVHFEHIATRLMQCGPSPKELPDMIEKMGHRWSRMRIRRRTGRSQTAKEMGMFSPLTAVLSNMENKHYTEKILLWIDFMKEFSSITKEEMDRA